MLQLLLDSCNVPWIVDLSRNISVGARNSWSINPLDHRLTWRTAHRDDEGAPVHCERHRKWGESTSRIKTSPGCWIYIYGVYMYIIILYTYVYTIHYRYTFTVITNKNKGNGKAWSNYLLTSHQSQGRTPVFSTPCDLRFFARAE